VSVSVLIKKVEITLLDNDAIVARMEVIPFVLMELAVKKEETAREEALTFCRYQSPL
jgi:hypothetical protein